MCGEKVYPANGPKYAIVPLCLTAILPLIFYFIADNVISSDFNARYTLFNLTAYSVVYIMLFMILEVSLRAKWHQMDTKSFNCKADEINDKEEQVDGVPNKTGSSTIWTTIASLSVTFLNIGFIVGYMLYIFPVYFGASVSSRMIICLIVHPIAVECKEALSRIGAASLAKSNDIDIAKTQILANSRMSFVGKIFLSYARRFMLLNIGDVSSTMITIVFTSMEEAVMRAFLVEIDMHIRKIMANQSCMDGRSSFSDLYGRLISISQVLPSLSPLLSLHLRTYFLNRTRLRLI